MSSKNQNPSPKPTDILAMNLRMLLARSNDRGKNLAAELEVSRETVSFWLNGKVVPKYVHLEKMADYFSVEVEALINPRLFIFTSQASDQGVLAVAS